MTHRPTLLQEAVVARLRRPLHRRPKEDFPALSDVSFDVSRGDAVGVIGRNGAGKSTLLKILSRIVLPTAGRIELFGRVGSLLEVGTGFHPELTGRENIYLNGAVLGMRRREIADRFDSIVDFAEVSQFLDTPVKRYSSGMYVRLAFAVAAHLNPEILVVDEVLAVGDAAFQKRCLGKMGEVTRELGRTVLFVSHNMSAIEALCQRCILLTAGSVSFDGTPTEAVERYFSSGSAGDEQGVGTFDLEHAARAGSGGAILRRLQTRRPDGVPSSMFRMGDGITFAIDCDGLAYPSHGVLLRILTATDIPLVAVNTVMKPVEVQGSGGRQDQLVVSIPSLPLTPGRYWVELLVGQGRMGRKALADHVERAGWFDVVVADVYGSGYAVGGIGPRSGPVFVDMEWELLSEGIVIASSSAAPVTRRHTGQ